MSKRRKKTWKQVVDINTNKYKALVLLLQIFGSKNDDDNDFYLSKYFYGFKPDMSAFLEATL